ncbi:MarR family winged helix-turn-helix transcriptional regulator [Oceanicoccus sp. KOV_DT_Chl]|uniref:MarR family winged helix-turn-helix transcriptional regulator n=1 Tax=Oceanicoccus sp. KOV_DT_Chl TaxID=1904639 RepID=UPI00135A48F2|nr:MarR family transcriptional regulator [Oceanicoccus sp. KOV_DT_Chl]
MQSLIQQCGHKGLRLSFEPFISLVDKNGCRPSELATLLNISKQACNQSINEIEIKGYLYRQPDPADGRGKILKLTPQGIRLKKDGMAAAAALQQQFANHLGQQAISELTHILFMLMTSLGIDQQRISGRQHNTPAILATLLPGLSNHIMQRLMQLTIEQGHPQLKLSHGQVFTLISNGGRRIQDIAAINNVSKQSISAIAAELVTLGYIQRITLPHDARQQLLTLTTQGELLIEDSVQSVKELEQDFIDILGNKNFIKLKSLVANLHKALNIEPTRYSDNSALLALAAKLRHQLSADDCLRLAQLLSQQDAATTHAIKATAPH